MKNKKKKRKNKRRQLVQEDISLPPTNSTDPLVPDADVPSDSSIVPPDELEVNDIFDEGKQIVTSPDTVAINCSYTNTVAIFFHVNTVVMIC